MTHPPKKGAATHTELAATVSFRDDDRKWERIEVRVGGD